MKHVSTGAGLCALAAAVAGFPIINQLAATERTAQASPAVASAIAAAAMTQAEPTIVWYGVQPANYMINGGNAAWTKGAIFRAWSDGRIEYRLYLPQADTQQCNLFTLPSSSECDWKIFSDPAAGLAVKADINNDKMVDGEDLSYLLASWGNAPPLSVPPSDCPLNLINP
jgi:hypothetical protein